ncbi:Bgt-557 [Blumeria graminis f. sp. tritici]|uniref:Bgt-557 n=2 Tax=Blumeria graminis f. sp. tritici TaxID=62690 RepID=A0A061HER5_BLUGR|nr:Cytosolic J-domain-containing protein [Blumeria graminis f. sp. tritici 96224]VCU40359.1 Bgt-557 [Blumeria graminis f. sp. tritici]
MPLRSYPSIPIHLRLKRYFHRSTRRYEGNYYEVLQITTTATQGEVKKAFYALSKAHHPDRNPTDPQASAKFIALSTAYSVLGTPSKRASYDLTILPASQAQSQYSPVQRGSYSSTNPAGGRSPSGLSRRRTRFCGPPPSFHRNGGWGEFAEKRRGASVSPARDKKKQANPAHSETYGELRSNQGYNQLKPDDVTHFDKASHLRTHENQQKRQTRSKRDIEDSEVEYARGIAGPFITVVGILSVGFCLPIALMATVQTS